MRGLNRPSLAPGEKALRALFVHQDAIERHLAAPHLHERGEYLAAMLDQGRNKGAVCERASLLLHVDAMVRPDVNGLVSNAEIEAGAVLWEAHGHSKHARHFQTAARSWFRFLRLYRHERTMGGHYANSLTEFRCSMEQSGYAKSTINGHLTFVAAFLEGLPLGRDCLDAVTLADIEHYLSEKHRSSWTLRTVTNAVRSLRVFFRFAESRGMHHGALSQLLTAPPVQRQYGTPRSPPWAEVRRMIEALDCETASGCRAKAILLLASVYGLRRSELIRLSLDDFDWRAGIFTVRRAKRGRVQQFPIQDEVGEAIIHYLQQVRPESTHRNLFLTLQRPYRPTLNLGPSLRKVMTQQNIFARDWGLHALRHACATELLRQGTSLRGIADFLGHRGLESVSIYAHCDERLLERVADFELDSVL